MGTKLNRVVFLVELPHELDEDDINQMLSAKKAQLRAEDNSESLELSNVSTWGHIKAHPTKPGLHEVMLLADQAVFTPGIDDEAAGDLLQCLRTGRATAYFAGSTKSPTILIGYAHAG